MKAKLTHPLGLVLLCFASLSAAAGLVIAIPNLMPIADPTGAAATFNAAGNIHEDNPFFQSLGTNGLTCATCHEPSEAFGISAAGVQQVYERTQGTDPLFAVFDGANCPTDNSTSRAAHSLLLERGLIRIGITLPVNPEFQISVVHDPYGCAMSTDPATGGPLISVYRRPLPSTNLRYLSAVMFDGRETLMPLNNASAFEANLTSDLSDQAIRRPSIPAAMSSPANSIEALRSSLLRQVVFTVSAACDDPRVVRLSAFFKSTATA
jgi:cytochrome c peroxidase